MMGHAQPEASLGIYAVRLSQLHPSSEGAFLPVLQLAWNYALACSAMYII